MLGTISPQDSMYGASFSSLSSSKPSLLSPPKSLSSAREKERLVHELSQTMEVIEKLEDVLSNEEVSPLGPILIAKVKCSTCHFVAIRRQLGLKPMTSLQML